MSVHAFPSGAPINTGPEYEPGDVVGLVSGGPPLTVLDYCEDCDNVDVGWFDGDSLEIATLPGAALVRL